MTIQELRNAGLSKSAAARELGIDRGTVSKYWDGVESGAEPPRYKIRGTNVDAYSEYITERLRKYPALSAEKLFQEISKQGYRGSRRSVRRFVSKIRPQQSRSFRPIEVLPGEQAQVDWGYCGSIVEDGMRKKLYVFVFTMSWSRAMYVEFITSLGMVTFAGCLHRALAYIGGVPSQVLFDNAKTVVAERVGHLVQFNENLLRLALRYGFTPKACWVADPESKGRVESNVKYVKNGFLYGLEYSALTELNQLARTWLDEVAHQRIHGTTAQVPAVQLDLERQHLQSFVPGDGPSGVVEERLVSKHGLVSVAQNAYSVPEHLQRKKIQIRRFESTIEILEAGEPVFRHELRSGRGHQVIIPEHYPQHVQKQPRVHPLQERFESLCSQAPAYLQGLTKSGGSLRDQMEQIVELGKTYSEEQMEAAMERSLAYGAFGYVRLKRILQLQTKAPASLPDVKPESATRKSPTGAFQRDPSYYAGVGA